MCETISLVVRCCLWRGDAGGASRLDQGVLSVQLGVMLAPTNFGAAAVVAIKGARVGVEWMG